MNEPQIGVVVPTLNSAATLEWTLCSLRAQKDITADVLVADSGSEDGTLEICKQWDVPTIYVPPGNMYRAINAGLQKTSAKWVTYLNSDDLVFPTSYAQLVALGEKRTASVVYGGCDFVDYQGRFCFTLKPPPPSRLLGVFRWGRLGFAQPAAIFRKTIYRDLGGFDERYRHIADLNFFFRSALAGHVFARLHSPAVAAFRLHASQLSSRELGVVKEEKTLQRNALGVKVSPGDFLDVLYWRLQNSPTYAWHLIMERRLRLYRHFRMVGRR